MAARRYEISLRLLKKYFTRSLRSLVKYFSTLEGEFRISKRPRNILYVINDGRRSKNGIDSDPRRVLANRVIKGC